MSDEYTEALLAGHQERVKDAAKNPRKSIPTSTILAYNTRPFVNAADVVRDVMCDVLDKIEQEHKVKSTLRRRIESRRATGNGPPIRQVINEHV